MSSAQDTAAFSHPDAPHRGQLGTGPFMLTLCRLPGPVSIRPPQSPHLKSFRFFTSRAAEANGGSWRYVHMGYFQTMADAERWAQRVRSRFPNAIATITPTELRQPCDVAAIPEFAPVKDEPLTDTQVLRLLEARYATSAQHDTAAAGGSKIGLLRPEDTSTRLALREAVARGAPVSFAVQLQWSEQPFDMTRLPSTPALKTHTLYATEQRREGRPRHFLRLGFFEDPLSARQVAAEILARYPSAVVVPVTQQEVGRALRAQTDTSGIRCLIEQAPESQAGADASQSATREFTHESKQSKSEADSRRHAAAGVEALERRLERLARREMWTEDSLSESGVRHLKIWVLKPKRGRA